MTSILAVIDKIIPYLSGTSGAVALAILFILRSRAKRLIRRILLVSGIVLMLWLILSPTSPITVTYTG